MLIGVFWFSIDGRCYSFAANFTIVMAYAARPLFNFGFTECLNILTHRRPLLFAYNICVFNRGFVSISAEVSEALKLHNPIVALESTIISHGLPFPQNLETALMVENVVRENGSVPATIAVLGGKLHVGLTTAELEHIATSKSNVVKSSRRDLAYIMSQKLDGGTTVSGTMIAAHMAGIKVFVTGGIGGVHRGAETTMDISADLRELGRTPVAVVCAGAKSILDIGRTLEYLETEGVPVVTLGDSREFPAFFTRQSGFLSPHRLNSTEEVAQLIADHLSLKLSNGLLVAVPIPKQFAMDAHEMHEAIQEAISEASQSGISGKELTPFLLNAVNQLTSGKSLKANVELIRNNAAVGSQIASHLAKISHHVAPAQHPVAMSSKVDDVFSTKQRSITVTTGDAAKINGPSPESYQFYAKESRKSANEKLAKRIVVSGGINFDLSVSLSKSSSSLETNGMTHRGHMRHSFGGVGRNIADCLSRLGMDPLFISAVGNDWMGKHFRECFTHMDLSAVAVSKHVPTAVYTAVLSSAGELLYGIGDFDIHKEVSPAYIKAFETEMKNASLMCIDGCLSAESIDFITDFCHQHNIPVLFEPTDIMQIDKLFNSNAWKKLTYVTPNINELQIFHHFLKFQENLISVKAPREFVKPETLSSALDFCRHLCTSVSEYVPNIIVTMGRHGLLLCQQIDQNSSESQHVNDQTLNGLCTYYEKNGITFLHHPAVWPGFPEPRIQSVLGAGDCLAATIIAAMQAGLPTSICARLGILAARKSLESFEAVPDTITPQLLVVTPQLYGTGIVN